jgi:signal transduction histidine kinase
MRSVGPLRQKISDSSLIAEVGRAVTGTLGLDEVLAVVVRAAEMLVSARCAAVALLSDDRQSLQLAATSGSLLTKQGDTFPVQGSLTGWAVQRGEAVISPGIGQDDRCDPAESRLGAGVIIPIESGTRVHGALLAARAVDAPIPSEGDEDALRKLAAYAAIAIENARLYREQTELSPKLQAKTDELEKAYADLSDSQERLLVSEKMAALGRVTAGLAHEINSPLGGILNCLQMAQTYVGEYRSSINDPDVKPEDHEAIATDLTEALALAEHSTRKVAQFVRTIKGQTRAGDGDLRVELEAADEIEGVIAVLQHELRSRNVTLKTELERGIPLMGDPGRLSLVVQNLLKNAIDAYEGAEGEVRISWAAQGADKAVLEVQDYGCGIAEEIRGRIFDYLFTTKDIGEGTGLGLSTVHSIVTSHFEGEVDFESAQGVGTTFSVTFPISPVKD